MKKIKNTLTRSLAAGREQATCKVESIISVDESGQMVIPRISGKRPESMQETS